MMQNNFNQLFKMIKDVNSDVEDRDGLYLFFKMLNRFNNEKEINEDFKEKVV